MSKRKKTQAQGLVMNRFAGTPSEQSFFVTDIKTITPTLVEVTASMRQNTGDVIVDKKGKKHKVQEVVSSTGIGGFANVDDFDLDIAIRAAFENAADNCLEGRDRVNTGFTPDMLEEMGA